MFATKDECFSQLKQSVCTSLLARSVKHRDVSLSDTKKVILKCMCGLLSVTVTRTDPLICTKLMIIILLYLYCMEVSGITEREISVTYTNRSCAIIWVSDR